MFQVLYMGPVVASLGPERLSGILSVEPVYALVNQIVVFKVGGDCSLANLLNKLGMTQS